MKIKALLLSVLLGATALLSAACVKEKEAVFIDYAAQVTLDMESTKTIKQEVTVKNYIDGDTTHFNVPKSLTSSDGKLIAPNGVLKARYLACNTPESTGKIEEWGKKASNFTKEHLKKATSIILETDGEDWEYDSTGERYLVWVWYKSPDTNGAYRCLNLELLQNGLAVGSKVSENRYGTICTNAINNATQLKLHVFSDDPDPDFFYGQAIEMTLKELRLNVEDYTGAKVAFEGTVTQYSSNGVYVEDWDEETQQWYGMYLYYGFTLGAYGEKLLQPGNRMRIVGKVSPYTSNYGTTYQICDLTYDFFDDDNPDNIQLISAGTETIAYTQTTAETFTGKKTIKVETEEEITQETFDYAALALHTTVSMNGLVVNNVYTTNNGGDSDGAITITCTLDGKTITLRTANKLQKPSGEYLLEDELKGTTLDVKGIVESFDGNYQIKVFTYPDLVIHTNE